MKSAWKIAAVLIGLALFGWYLAQADLPAVWDAIGRLGWAAPLVLLPYFVVYCVDCLAWSRTLLVHRSVVRRLRTSERPGGP